MVCSALLTIAVLQGRQGGGVTFPYGVMDADRHNLLLRVSERTILPAPKGSRRATLLFVPRFKTRYKSFAIASKDGFFDFGPKNVPVPGLYKIILYSDVQAQSGRAPDFALGLILAGHEPILRNQPSSASGLSFEFGQNLDFSDVSTVRFYCVNDTFDPANGNPDSPDTGELADGWLQKYGEIAGQKGVNPWGTFTFDPNSAKEGQVVLVAVYTQATPQAPFVFDTLSKAFKPQGGLTKKPVKMSALTAKTKTVEISYAKQ